MWKHDIYPISLHTNRPHKEVNSMSGNGSTKISVKLLVILKIICIGTDIESVDIVGMHATI